MNGLDGYTCIKVDLSSIQLLPFVVYNVSCSNVNNNKEHFDQIN